MLNFSFLRVPLAALLLAAAFAQTGGVGIGTTAPDVSAALDIVSATKGALLPRVASAAALATPATGLLVFQTGASISGGGAGIRADGGLNLGQNSDQNIYLSYQAGRLNTGSSNLFSGYQSGYSNSIGQHNLFSGHQSGYANTTGYSNVFMGNNSGLHNTTGNNNAFNDLTSGAYNTTGSTNQFAGVKSGYGTTTGSGNVFGGYQSG